MEGEGAQRGDGRATDGDREEADEEEQEKEDDGEDVERLGAEPEASARVRLVSAGGELLGEAWAELAGAPDDWARYPLYSPGAVGIDSSTGSAACGRAGSGDAPATLAANANRPTGLDRGGVIPAPPATVRRRWGWRYRRDGSEKSSRRWFRPPPPPRDVAGEVRLRLGWVPSGLAVTVHRYRAAGRAAATGTGVADCGGTIRPLAGGRRRRPSIVVRAEPGGGAARAHPVELDMDGDVVEEDAWVASENDGVQRSATVSKQSDGLPPSHHQEVVPVGGQGAAAEAADNSSESFFFVLDTSCLLGGWNGDDGGGDDGGDIDSGDGARLILSMTADDVTVQDDDSTAAGVGASDSAEEGAMSNSASLASAELLLFPGAEPARRWVQLTDTVGDTLGEVDVTIAWAVAPPLPPLLSPTRRSSSGVAVVESQGQQEDAPVMTDTTAATRTASPPGSSLEALLAPDGETRSNGDDPEGGGARAEAEAEAGATSDGDGGVEPFPEPAQVVSRCFSMHASDLVLRVSDLDVAVLVTMAKGIVRVRMCAICL